MGFLTKLFRSRRPSVRGWAVMQGMHVLSVQSSRKKAKNYARRCEYFAKKPHKYCISIVKMIEL